MKLIASFVLLWQTSECIDLFVIDYIFVSFSENKYDVMMMMMMMF